MDLDLTVPREETKERFCEVVRLHSGAMFRTARALTGSDADAEDAVGEAVLRAWQSYGALRDPLAVRAWLLKITANCAREQYRKTGRLIPVDTLETAAPERDADAAQDLWQAVNRLPRDQRAAVVLFYYEDLTLAQSAPILGVAQGTVKSRLSRARARLRVLLDEEEEI